MKYNNNIYIIESIDNINDISTSHDNGNKMKSIVDELNLTENIDWKICLSKITEKNIW